MKHLLLDIKKDKKFNKVKYLAIDLPSIKFIKENHDGNDFDVKFNIELLDSDEIVLDYGYGFTDIKINDLKKIENFYELNLYIKGLDSDLFPSKNITVHLNDLSYETLNNLFNSKDKFHEKIMILKNKGKLLLEKTKFDQKENIDNIKSSAKKISHNMKKQACEYHNTTKDFIHRAKRNELTKKEKLFSGVTIGLTAIAFLAGKNIKK